MYVCDFCEEETDRVIRFVVINAYTQTQKADDTLKLCFSCFEENIGLKILIDDVSKQNSADAFQNVDCVFCKKVECWASGNTKDCAIEITHRWVQYRICKKCWKKERDY